MKPKEIRELSVVEIQGKVSEFQEELFNLRFQARMGQLSNCLRIRVVRRDIARSNTIILEKMKSEIKA